MVKSQWILTLYRVNQLITLCYWLTQNELPQMFVLQTSNIYWAHNSVGWQMGSGLTWIIYLLLHWAHSCIYRLLSGLVGCLLKSSKLTALMTGDLACNFGLAGSGFQESKSESCKASGGLVSELAQCPSCNHRSKHITKPAQIPTVEKSTLSTDVELQNLVLILQFFHT